MPNLGDHPSEMNRSYTPLEKRRRAEMHVRGTQYGFYPVAKDAVCPILCANCGNAINGQTLNINGRVTHYNKCV